MNEADLRSELEKLQLFSRFMESYERELNAIRADARLGGELGISATPTVFIDGRVGRHIERATDLEAILSYSVQKLNGQGKGGRLQ